MRFAPHCNSVLREPMLAAEGETNTFEEGTRDSFYKRPGGSRMLGFFRPTREPGSASWRSTGGSERRERRRSVLTCTMPVRSCHGILKNPATRSVLSFFLNQVTKAPSLCCAKISFTPRKVRLLHGTQPKLVLSILTNGMNERFAGSRCVKYVFAQHVPCAFCI